MKSYLKIGLVRAVLVLLMALTSLAVQAVTASAGTTTIYLDKLTEQKDLSASSGDYIITQTDPTKQIEGVLIKICGGVHTVTLSKINMKSSIVLASDTSGNGSTVNLKLSGSNYIDSYWNDFCPGVYVWPNSTLNISDAGNGDGTLTAYGGVSAPGIGGGQEVSSCGTININSGTIHAYGGNHASGIGTGINAKGGTININGGNVYAYGNNGGAGIGTSSHSNEGTVTVNINGGSVNAYKSINDDDFYVSAAIGSGILAGSDIRINITGGTVNATGNIGCSDVSNSPVINISGGIVTTDEIIGANSAPATVNISDGTVHAKGVGVSNGGTTVSVTVTGGIVVGGVFIGSDRKNSLVYISGGSVKAPYVYGQPVKSSSNSTSVYKTKLHFDNYPNAPVTNLKVTQGGTSAYYGTGTMLSCMTDDNGDIYMYLPANSGDTVVNGDTISGSTFSHLSYHGTVGAVNLLNGCNFLKQDQPYITITGMQSQYIQGAAITPGITGGNSSGSVTYTYTGTTYTGSHYNATDIPSKIGTYTLTATKAGTDSYFDAVATYRFSIIENTSYLNVANIPAQTYTAFDALTPALIVTSGSVTNTAGTDYTATYTNNRNVGTATVTINGTGNYEGYTRTKSFTIKPKVMTFNSGSIELTTYTGTEIKPGVIIYDSDKLLTEATDYALSYSNNLNVGTATTTVRGIGNYAGSSGSASFNILKADQATLNITGMQAQYTHALGSSSISPSTTGGSGSGAVTYHYTGNNGYGSYDSTLAPTLVGDYTLTATRAGSSNYNAITATYNFSIEENPFYLNVADIPAQTYTGSSLTPALAVKSNSTNNILGTDYTATYTNNINVGTATVTVNGKGNYEGYIRTKTFTINPKVITFNVDDIADVTYTGVANKPAIKVYDGSIMLTEGTDYTLVYTGNTDVGIATVNITGKGVYAGSSASGKFNVLAAPKVPFISRISPTYGSASGSTTVIITGTGFTGATAVKFGSTAGTSFTITNDTTITATSPAGSGTVDITVSGPGGTSATSSSDQFSYVAPIPEALAVSNPSTTGFTVALSPSLDDLSSNFTLHDSSLHSVPITGATTPDNGATYVISAVLSAGQTYTITATKTGYNFGTAQSVVVPDQAAPTALVGVSPTTAENIDGQITGVSDSMEYQLKGTAGFTAVTASTTSITGLAAGTYEVRYAAKTGINAGAAAEVVVAPTAGCLVTYQGAQARVNSVDHTAYDIRFIATINTLDASSVGFVFSKSEMNPTKGNSSVKSTTKVYTSITAWGSSVTADIFNNAEYIIACTVTGIPASDINKPLIVRAFSTVGTETTYTSVKAVTVSSLRKR